MKMKRIALLVCVAALTACVFGVPAYAASGDVAGAIEGTWTTASQQIKTVVDNVVFPAIDLILAVFFFAKLGTAYFDYRKHGQFELSLIHILSEYFRLQIIAAGVREAVEDAIISTVNDNYAGVYHGVREGYSGSYLPAGESDWETAVSESDIYTYLDSTIGTEWSLSLIHILWILRSRSSSA